MKAKSIKASALIKFWRGWVTELPKPVTIPMGQYRIIYPPRQNGVVLN